MPVSASRFDPIAAAPDLKDALLHNGSAAALFELAVKRGEGQVASTGAILVNTGMHTGRSAADDFIGRKGTALVWRLP